MWNNGKAGRREGGKAGRREAGGGRREAGGALERALQVGDHSTNGIALVESARQAR